jgi:hypothetical protein
MTRHDAEKRPKPKVAQRSLTRKETACIDPSLSRNDTVR